MWLTSPRFIFPMIVVALAALMVVSCGQQNLPTSPSLMTSASGGQQTVRALFETLVDETPAAGAANFRPLDEDEPPPPPPAPGTRWSPWPPDGFPRALPGVPVPGFPSTHQRMHVKVDPEPNDGVRHDGKPVGTYSCRDNRYTWYYDQIVATDTGIAVKITKRYNFFDGRYVNKNENSFSVNGNSSVTLHTRWCSAIPRPHYAQTIFTGEDDNHEQITFNAPFVALLSP